MHSLRFILAFLLVVPAAGQAAAPVAKLALGSGQSQAVRTGGKNYSQLSLAQGTVRVGSNTSLLATNEGGVQLEHGLALVASKSKFFRPSVQVRTAKHQLRVRGTAQVYHGADGSLRVAVLEGRLTLALNSLSGEQVTLRAGEAMLVKPVDRALPKALMFDLDRLMASAELVSGRQFPELPTRELVDQAATRQSQEIQRANAASDAEGEEEESDEGDVAGTDAGGADTRVEEITQDDVGEEIPDLDGDGQDDDTDPDFVGDGTDEGDVPADGADTPVDPDAPADDAPPADEPPP